MNHSLATVCCSLLLGASIALAPTSALATDAVQADAAQADVAQSDAASADGNRLTTFANEVVDSIEKPVKIIGLHAHSYHTKIYSTSYTIDGRRQKFNNETLGLYLINEDGWGAGYYRNSVHRNTFYGGRFVEIWGPLDVALGIATGYNSTVVPMIVPNVHVGPARLWIQPAIGGPNNTTMIHLSFEFER